VGEGREERQLQPVYLTGDTISGVTTTQYGKLDR